MLSEQANKKSAFGKQLFNRFKLVDIECNDAIKVIQSRDCKNAFFYVDPPYFNANMGHYKGYTEQQFSDLLECLGNIKGKFLLSSYPSDVLNNFIQKHNLQSIQKNRTIAVNHNARKPKTECLTANYDILSLVK